jgi:hypothetical protein
MKIGLTVNQHLPKNHEGWIVTDEYAVFCWVPVPPSVPQWLAQLLLFTTYLLTTHKQAVS